MIVWRVLTVVLAALPATWFCYFAPAAVVHGLGNTFLGIFTLDAKTVAFGVLALGLGSFALYGTYCLWMVGLGRVTNWVLTRTGLVAGTIAYVPVFFIFKWSPSDWTDPWTLVLFGPPVAACGWLLFSFLGDPGNGRKAGSVAR